MNSIMNFLGSIKYGEYSWLSGKLLASEEDLCCIELVWIWLCSEINDKHHKSIVFIIFYIGLIILAYLLLVFESQYLKSFLEIRKLPCDQKE